MHRVGDAAADYFESIVQASPDGIRILDLNGCVEFMNPGGCKLFGVRNFDKDTKGRYWPDVWPAEFQPVVDAAWRAAANGETRSFRACCLTTGGRLLWLDTTVSPVYGAGSRTVRRVLATSRDVSEEVAGRTLLDTLMNCVPAALFAKDLETGRFVFLNDAAATLFGHPAAEMVGQAADSFVLPEQAGSIREADLRAASMDETYVVDGEIVTQLDGKTHCRRTRKRATPAGPGARYVVCLTEDITEERERALALQRALDEAESANRAKTEFLAVMSHEIRSPLNGVLGMAQAIDMGELSAEQRQRLKVLREAGGVLLDLLNDLLDLSRINAGRLQLDDGRVDVDALGVAAKNLFDGLAVAKDLSFELDLDPAAAGHWRGDPVRVRQIVTNLISNAVKFTDHGQVCLRIGAEDDALLLEVSDTGLGIPDDMRERIFAPFDQLDISATRRHGGSGLGLAICRSLAELMGGQIAVRSTSGQGSLFSVRLRLERAAPLALQTEPALEELAWRPPVGDSALRILAAEDNPTNQLVLSTLLGAMGLQPYIVANGQEAVDAWQREPWDLILMDVQMPVLDGRAATRSIRALERIGGLRHTPIIGLTANAMQHQLEEYAACGMDSVVSKPIDIRALMEAIHGRLAVAAA